MYQYNGIDDRLAGGRIQDFGKGRTLFIRSGPKTLDTLQAGLVMTKGATCGILLAGNNEPLANAEAALRVLLTGRALADSTCRADGDDFIP